MNEQLISSKTAKLAMEKGYARKDRKEAPFIFLPTQSILQKWLRDIHEIYIEIRWNMDSKPYHFIVIKAPNVTKKERSAYVEHPGFKKYEDALELALQESLKLIV